MEHPQARQAFKEGLESILRQWTALELAVINQWGGNNSAEKANELYEEILNKFYTSTSRIYKDDLIIFIEEFMETKFNTICEDESPVELGEILAEMWNQCIQGDFTLVTNALAREYSRHEILQQCQGIDQSGDELMDDDDVAGAGGEGGGDDDDDEEEEVDMNMEEDNTMIHNTTTTTNTNTTTTNTTTNTTINTTINTHDNNINIQQTHNNDEWEAVTRGKNRKKK